MSKHRRQQSNTFMDDMQANQEGSGFMDQLKKGQLGKLSNFKRKLSSEADFFLNLISDR